MKLKIQLVAVPMAAPLVRILSELISVGYNHYRESVPPYASDVSWAGAIPELPATQCRKRHSTEKRTQWRRRQSLSASPPNNLESLYIEAES
jgi:hypothetical protein